MDDYDDRHRCDELLRRLLKTPPNRARNLLRKCVALRGSLLGLAENALVVKI
jgi:hypothetical protein